jgi:RimJ/RimL family protein N-acetyltransferase
VPFELQPTLRGELLEVRPLRPDDWDALFAAASDPLIWEQHPNSDRYKEDVFREYFRGAMESGGAFVILDAKTGRVIGSSRYHGYDEGRSEIEIGWTFLAREYWGGTYNGELFVDTVLFLVGPANLRSQKALQKIGAVPAGSRTDPTGRESLVFSIRR